MEVIIQDLAPYLFASYITLSVSGVSGYTCARGKAQTSLPSGGYSGHGGRLKSMTTKFDHTVWQDVYTP